MDYPLEPVTTPPAPPSPPRFEATQGRRRSPRTWVHLLLLAVSTVTLWVAGVFFWEMPASLRAEDLIPSILRGAGYMISTLLILGSHEMGHYFACRAYGIPASLPYFIPGIPPLGSFGAVIRIRGPIPDRRALFDVAAAGPIAGFVVAIPILTYGVLTAETITVSAPTSGAMYFGEPVILILLRRLLLGDVDIVMNSWIAAGWVGMLVTSLNLFPVGQLDGGHAAYAISRKLHRRLTLFTLAALLGAILYQSIWMGVLPAYVLWFAILIWMRDRHPRLIDESGTLGKRREAVAVILALLFVLSFIFLPIRIL